MYHHTRKSANRVISKSICTSICSQVPCPVCHGFGAASFVTCNHCGGSGKRTNDTPLSNVGSSPAGISCVCHHSPTGTTATESAGSCQGSGDGGSNSSSSRRSTSSGRSGCLDGRGTPVERGTLDGGKDEADAAGRLKLTRTTDCAKCSGSGKVPAPREEEEEVLYCTHCAGARFVEESAKQSFPIPPGVVNGHTEVYRGKGHVDIAGALPSLFQHFFSRTY